MLFGLFSKVFGVKESIFGVKKAKIWAWKKIAKKQVERRKKKVECLQKIWIKNVELVCERFCKKNWTNVENIENVVEMNEKTGYGAF